MEQNSINYAIVYADGLIYEQSSALFPWWSMTKTVLAAAVLRLVDQGRLSLDDRYRDRPYTIRQLLQHTAGVNNYGGPAYHAAVASGEPVWPITALLQRVRSDRLIFTPGQGWAYSNIGYLFVRQLLETLVGHPLDYALRALIFAPMGMQHTRIATTPSDIAQTYWGNPTGYDPRWV